MELGLVFSICAANNPCNLVMLNNIKDFFGVGYVTLPSAGMIYYQV